MPTAFIIGASRGIGLELARQYRAQGWRVLATARSSAACEQLLELGIEAHQADILNVEHCAALAWKLDDEKLDIAILNAGIYGPDTQGLQTPQVTDFDSVMQTNVLAAMRLLPIVAPLVGAAGGKLAVISSAMASMGERSQNSGWLYRASKAALNSVLCDVARAMPQHQAICVSLHPGWVRTDMGGAAADLSVEQSAAGIRQTLSKLSAEQNGAFLNYDGRAIAW